MIRIASASPKTCLTSRGRGKCAIDAKTVESRQAKYTAIILQLQARYGFRVVDLKAAFCDKRLCRASHEGLILYRDPHHLGIHGNAFLLKYGPMLE